MIHNKLKARLFWLLPHLFFFHKISSLLCILPPLNSKQTINYFRWLNNFGCVCDGMTENYDIVFNFLHLIFIWSGFGLILYLAIDYDKIKERIKRNKRGKQNESGLQRM